MATTISTGAIFSLGSIVDDMVSTVTATVYLAGSQLPLQLILWSGQSYIDIGNWTNDNALSRITQLLNAGAAS